MASQNQQSTSTQVSTHDQKDIISVQRGDNVDDVPYQKGQIEPMDADVALQLVGDAPVSNIDPAITRRALRKIDFYILPLLRSVTLVSRVHFTADCSS